MTHFEHENYDVRMSLNMDHIYIKFVNRATFAIYDSKFSAKETNLDFSLDKIYKMLINCFKNEQDYKFEIKEYSSAIKLSFDFIVGHIIDVNFALMLQEKILSNNEDVTASFNKINKELSDQLAIITSNNTNLTNTCNEQKQRIDELLNNLFEITTSLGFAEISFTTVSGVAFIPINSTKFTFSQPSNDLTNESKIKYLYALDTLEYDEKRDTGLHSLNAISNHNLRELIIKNTKRNDITFIKNFPNLKKLTIFAHAQHQIPITALEILSTTSLETIVLLNSTISVHAATELCNSYGIKFQATE